MVIPLDKTSICLILYKSYIAFYLQGDCQGEHDLGDQLPVQAGDCGREHDDHQTEAAAQVGDGVGNLQRVGFLQAKISSKYLIFQILTRQEFDLTSANDGHNNNRHLSSKLTTDFDGLFFREYYFDMPYLYESPSKSSIIDGHFRQLSPAKLRMFFLRGGISFGYCTIQDRFRVDPAASNLFISVLSSLNFWQRSSKVATR